MVRQSIRHDKCLRRALRRLTVRARRHANSLTRLLRSSPFIGKLFSFCPPGEPICNPLSCASRDRNVVAADLACAQHDAGSNETLRADDREVIMMRHAYLDEGSYDYWYQQSATGVWPWFERLGARILGDFEIIYPLSEDQTPGQDEALRFARYASYEHWQATGWSKRRRYRRIPAWPVTGDSAMPATLRLAQSPRSAGLTRRPVPAGLYGRPARFTCPAPASASKQFLRGQPTASGRCARPLRCRASRFWDSNTGRFRKAVLRSTIRSPGTSCIPL